MCLNGNDLEDDKQKESRRYLEDHYRKYANEQKSRIIQ